MALLFSVTEQPLVPLQLPPQPTKVRPLPGVSISVTGVPVTNVAMQVPPVQLMPAGFEVTVPSPSTVTVSVVVVSKLAVTLASAPA